MTTIILYKYRGHCYNQMEFAALLGVNVGTLCHRVKRGWPMEFLGLPKKLGIPLFQLRTLGPTLPGYIPPEEAPVILRKGDPGFEEALAAKSIYGVSKSCSHAVVHQPHSPEESYTEEELKELWSYSTGESMYNRLSKLADFAGVSYSAAEAMVKRWSIERAARLAVNRGNQ